MSGFYVEMSECAYILQHISNRSLVLIDELGRSKWGSSHVYTCATFSRIVGTSADEGAGICYAICEQFVRSRAQVFFATHFLDLTDMLDASYSNVEKYVLLKTKGP